MRARRAPQAFDVDAENAEALALFLRMATQWTVNHNGVAGMNYQSLAWMMGLCAPPDRHAALLDDLQAMESAALVVLRERAD